MAAAELVIVSPMGERGHVPVLLNEVLEALAPHDGGGYVDGTFGRGGYAAPERAVDIEAVGADCQRIDHFARKDGLVHRASQGLSLIHI